jgi:hypothetical protein
MSSSVPSVKEKGGENDSRFKPEHNTEDPDAEFGGTEARRVLEKKLLRRIDLRMSIMVVIYILNYVCFCSLIPLILSKVRCLLLQIDRNNAGLAECLRLKRSIVTSALLELRDYVGLKKICILKVGFDVVTM